MSKRNSNQGMSLLERVLTNRHLLLIAAIVGSGVFFYLQSPNFLSPNNLLNILQNSVDLAIISAGMTLVIISAGIDVSVGGILAVSAIVVGRAFQADLPIPVTIGLGLAVGALLGALNGIVVSRFKVPPIIATLGTMYIWLSVLYIVIGGEWISGLPGTLSPLIQGRILGVPMPLIILLVVYGGCWFLLQHLPYGKHLTAIGSDEDAARLAGVSVGRIKISAYVLVGLLAGFGALLYIARLQTVEINIGTTIALDAIAAVILGGTNIEGGEGGLFGTLLGVFFIKIMQNGLILIGLSSLWGRAIVGLLLVIVLALDMLQRHQARQAATA